MHKHVLDCGDVESNPGPSLRGWGSVDYALHEDLFLQLGVVFGMELPRVDVFACKENALCASWWDCKQNAFSKFWGGVCGFG